MNGSNTVILQPERLREDMDGQSTFSERRRWDRAFPFSRDLFLRANYWLPLLMVMDWVMVLLEISSSFRN